MNPHLAKPHQASGTMLRKLLRTTPLAWLQVKRERMRLLVAVADVALRKRCPRHVVAVGGRGHGYGRCSDVCS
jgi:hypothetical protein